MANIWETIRGEGLIAEIKPQDEEHAIKLADALKAGGIGIVLVDAPLAMMHREEFIAGIVKALRAQRPDMIVGIHGFFEKSEVKTMLDAGAGFVANIGFNKEAVAAYVADETPVIVDLPKPELLGEAVDAGVPMVWVWQKYMDNGKMYEKQATIPPEYIVVKEDENIDESNVADYLRKPGVAACVTAWPAKAGEKGKEDYPEVTRRAKALVDQSFGLHIAHVGINAEAPDEAEKIAALFGKLLSLPCYPHPPCVFAGSLIEVMRQNGRGKKGHIAIGTNSVTRARYFIQGNGFVFDESSAQPQKDGSVKPVYLDGDFGGFAVHVLQC